ncbi:aromatic ring-hydroxylating dioxygenase subunit alpha [Pseudomaricurvus alkylphenolicus]|uniref:aromatic ring-hydroxylating oxygenase subunit alpha n=1 Tax=Pseudomaricurvus alkylphenolicus TaxID=1306991 RepID=UPI001422669E|nr:aromatic ring-hydroxylating dioxygenase subunit alpha [Pseudomaricurvus alkylphenolicus]NIB38887.1 aromatic ring-hydroxylating dioxygenase subunit alpha [Pseudomaricurvus alkylphenolicus]
MPIDTMSTINDTYNDYQKGFGTEDSPNWRELAGKDARRIPATLLEENSPNLGSAKIPPGRYTSRDYHREEVEKVWKRTWQVVCREDEIPNPGDHFVYDVAGMSFLIVRTEDNEFKGYWNVCLHRGRKLVDKSGCGAKGFRCAYHAWSWDLKGNLAYYPGKWDFPDVEAEKFGLRETAIDTWGGFIFINPDANAKPLANHMGSMPKHFESWPLEKRHTLWHVQKRINANWKVGIEAFLEAYHVVQTHPQALSSVAEHGTQYDVWDEGEAAFSRLITPTAVPSDHSKEGTPLGAIADVWALLNGLRMDEANSLPEDIYDRATLAEWRRHSLGEMTKADYSDVPDAMMLDSIQYWLFPNFCPWFGEGLPLIYQFRPDADDPDTCFMDVWMLVRSPDEGPAPVAPEVIRLGPDDKFEPHIGAMGLIFDQDDFNMPQVQEGLKTWPGDPDGVTLARYQEMRVRFLHQILTRVMSTP